MCVDQKFTLYFYASWVETSANDITLPTGLAKKPRAYGFVHFVNP